MAFIGNICQLWFYLTGRGVSPHKARLKSGEAFTLSISAHDKLLIFGVAGGGMWMDAKTSPQGDLETKASRLGEPFNSCGKYAPHSI